MIADTDLDIFAVQAELGLSDPIYDFTGNVIVGGINKWSFFRPGGIRANATTHLVEYYAASGQFPFGDFRRYNHTTSPPTVSPAILHPWGPGGTTTTINVSVFPNKLNIKEIQEYDSGAYDRYTLKFYSSAAARLAQTGPVHTLIEPITWGSVSPPVGHTNDQIWEPDSPQTIVVTGVPVAYPTLYLDTYVSDAGGNEKIRFDDSYTTITLTEYTYPVMKATKSILAKDLPAGNSPAGYPWSATGSRFQIYSAATPQCSAASVNQAVSGSAYNFYWTVVVMDTMGNQYTAGITSINLRTYLDDGSMSYDQAIETGTFNSDPTTQRNESGNITGASFAYGDAWEVYYDNSSSGSDISYNGTYSAC